MSIVLSMIKQLIATRVRKPDAETIIQALRDMFASDGTSPSPQDLRVVLQVMPAFRRLTRAKFLPIEPPDSAEGRPPKPGLLVDLGGLSDDAGIREVLAEFGEWRVMRKK